MNPNQGTVHARMGYCPSLIVPMDMEYTPCYGWVSLARKLCNASLPGTKDSFRAVVDRAIHHGNYPWTILPGYTVDRYDAYPGKTRVESLLMV